MKSLILEKGEMCAGNELWNHATVSLHNKGQSLIL